MTLEGAWLAPGTLGDVLRRSTEHLAAKGSDTPRLDAELLLAHALGVARIDLYMQLDRPLEPSELDATRALVGRRAAREPLQYVLGEWGFRRLTLTVDRRALIPRPETEVVVERCLALLEGLDAPRVLDVGTGSGAIALAIADEHPGAAVTGIDVSSEALALARENAIRTGLPLELARHDLFEGLPDGPWALVVSNPPYVDPDDRSSLQPEVRDWEPAEALFGRDGRRRRRTGRRDGTRRGRRARARGGRRPGGRDRGAPPLARVHGRPGDTRPRRARPGRRGPPVSAVDAAIAALRAGGLAVIPTDTVYGLAADGRSEDAARALYAAKGRDAIQPTALLFASVDVLEEHLPELPARARAMARALLPGPLTLVLPEPGATVRMAQRAPPRSGRAPASRPSPAPAGDVLTALGVLVATSANLPGQPDPRRVEDVPAGDPRRRRRGRGRRRAARDALDRRRPDGRRAPRSPRGRRACPRRPRTPYRLLTRSP